MGDAARPFRPIAPRTLTSADGVGVGQQPPNGAPSDEGRMKRASTACKECQRRRTRCSGVPCSECVGHPDRECVFDELSDRRRKATAKKTQEELTSLRDFLDQLLEAFRSNDGAAVQHLINRIRAGASHEEIRRIVLHIHAQTAGSSSRPNDMDPNIINDHMSHFFDSH
ncbi:uncharacterized protein N7503_008360 [Penicillium pulvis]|uniref:uncharacterized protein n=1 Tax=Penicillium pulvis TaxID=1562058 RepID=UPI0025466705|nr:uncharacterized protein N7503_008360 [Penicillium pulvis]KAJ5792382.1 hypothetical protein N7503_008360 [Penicillium pulvis]